MATKKEWFMAIRLRSLACFFAPVLVACAYSYMVSPKQFNIIRGVLATITSVFLQIALNLTNDYQEGKKGTDKNKTDEHIVALSLSEPKNVLFVSLVAYIISGISGLLLIYLCGKWWLIIVGIISFVVAWCYTGGPWPYGYHSLGEVAAFLFPGPVALLGTIYTQGVPITLPAILVSISLGLFSCSVLMNDNLRDIRHDPLNNKRTLAVVIGDKNSRKLYGVEVIIGILFTVFASFAKPSLLIVLLVLPLYYTNIKKITFQNVKGSVLRATLDVSGQALVLFAFCLALGFLLP
jgi:1,4-dihydroxy-2-naphthoate octaprenyltransferase